MSRQLAFVIDLKRCIGCDTCVIGCKVEAGLEADLSPDETVAHGAAIHAAITVGSIRGT